MPLLTLVSDVGSEALTQTAHETFDSRALAVTSRQHLVLIWFALRERQGNTIGIAEHRSPLI